MRQVLFTIPIFGGLKVFGYGAMLVVAFVSSTWLAYWRARRERLDPEVIGDMSFWVFLFGLIGARLFYCIEYWGDDIKTLWDVVQYWKGGVVYYGGIVGGVARVFLLLEASAISHASLHGCTCSVDRGGDALWPPGMFFERLLLRRHLPASLGGFFSGLLASLGPAFSDLGLIPPSAPYSLPVHPTQIYSAIDALVLFLLLDGLLSAPPARRRGHGLLMLTYPISRFVIEYLRNDEGVFFAGMTISQTISVVLFS